MLKFCKLIWFKLLICVILIVVILGINCISCVFKICVVVILFGYRIKILSVWWFNCCLYVLVKWINKYVNLLVVKFWFLKIVVKLCIIVEYSLGYCLWIFCNLVVGGMGLLILLCCRVICICVVKLFNKWLFVLND